MPPRPCPYLVKSAAKPGSSQKRVLTLWPSIGIPANCPRFNHPFAAGLNGTKKHNLNQWILNALMECRKWMHFVRSADREVR